MPPQRSKRSFAERAGATGTHPLAAHLMSLMSIKRSNLCLSADVYTTAELLALADETGDAICLLKTHADAVDDWSDRTVRGLQDLARRKGFLLFEDRKFGDIGNTVQSQYTRGPQRIVEWAHLTNAHLLPGPAIVSALRDAAQASLVASHQTTTTVISTGTPRVGSHKNEKDYFPKSSAQISSPAAARPDTRKDAATSDPVVFRHHRTSSAEHQGEPSKLTATTVISQTFEPTSPTPHAPALLSSLSTDSDWADGDRVQALETLGPPPNVRGLLLLAQMSSAGNLADTSYTKACIATAQQHKDFVLGYVAQENLNEHQDAFLVLTPGVSLPPEAEPDLKGDGKGQQYRTPETVIEEAGVDIVIVGRAILQAVDRRHEAERYRQRAWSAYTRMVDS